MFLELLPLGGEKTFKPHSQNRILVLLRGSKSFFLVLNWKFPLTLTKFESPLGEIACYTFKVIKNWFWFLRVFIPGLLSGKNVTGDNVLLNWYFQATPTKRILYLLGVLWPFLIESPPLGWKVAALLSYLCYSFLRHFFSHLFFPCSY